MIDVQVTSTADVIQEQIAHLSDETMKALDGAIKDATYVVQSYAQSHIQGGLRSGRKRKGGIRSAPGEWPKSDSGHLVSNIFVNFGYLLGYVGTNVEYGEYLELGTQKMSARPWLQRSLNENQDTINALIAKAMGSVYR